MRSRRTLGFRTGVLLLVVLAAACGSDKKDSEPPTTVSTPTSSIAPTSVAESSTTTAPASASTTTIGSTTAATVVIESLTGPALPVECNAPTMEELAWKTRGATKVELFVGTQRLGQYANGAASEIVPLKCDGSSRTYTLKATKGGETAQRSITLTTKPI